MKEQSDEQILSAIEVHSSNAVKLLKRSHEMHMSALDLDNLDAYIVLMKRSLSFQKLAADEINKAANLQNLFSQRHLDSILNEKAKFGIF